MAERIEREKSHLTSVRLIYTCVRLHMCSYRQSNQFPSMTMKIPINLCNEHFCLPCTQGLARPHATRYTSQDICYASATMHSDYLLSAVCNRRNKRSMDNDNACGYKAVADGLGGTSWESLLESYHGAGVVLGELTWADADFLEWLAKI